MAIYHEDIVSIDLESGTIHRSFLNHTIGSGDELANRFGVRTFRNGTAEDIGGTCTGYFIRADGTTVVISGGTVSGNLAYVDLPDTCYTVEGNFTLAIKCSGDGVTGTLRIVDGVVSRTSTETYVDPGTVIPSIEDLIEQIEAAVALIPAGYSANQYAKADTSLWEQGSVASSDGTNSTSTTRIRTKGKIPAGVVGLIPEYGYKVAVMAYNATTGAYIGCYNGSSFVTSGATWFTDRVDISTDMRGYKYRLVFANTGNTTIVHADAANLLLVYETDDTLTIPSVAADAEQTGIYARNLKRYNRMDILDFDSGVSDVYNGITYTKGADRTWTISGTASANSFCDLLKAFPLEGIKGLYVNFNGGTIALRYYLNYSGGSYDQGTLYQSGYISIPDGVVSIDVRYQIFVNESIAEGTTVRYSMVSIGEGVNADGVLISTGDTTDRTTDIETALGSGVCILGEGVFYTTGITMPDYSTLCGQGWGTIIALSGSSAGTAVKMGAGCNVKDMQIRGTDSPLSMPPPSSDGNRNGISFDGTGVTGRIKGTIHNCWIHDFTGGGIRLQKTGYPSNGGLNISDCDIERNYCGIFNEDDSEFHRITNVSMTQNRYGAICNGANNQFTCCGFNSNINGFMIDNENGTHTNTAHGGVSMCNFMHNNNRSIILKGIVSGFIFSGCNIDGMKYQDNSYNVPLLFKNTTNVVFSGCSFMDYVKEIEVDGQGKTDSNVTIGNMILFGGCAFRPEFDTLTVKNSAVKAQVKMEGCYYWDGTAVNISNL